MEMSENVINELCCYENVVVGTKMSILAQLVWIIQYFSHFAPFLEPFWHPWAQNWGTKLLEVTENLVNELHWYENGVIGTKVAS